MKNILLIFIILFTLGTTDPPHLLTARKYVNIREATGHNDGPQVEMFLKSVGRSKGDSWCAAFVSYCLTQGKVVTPTVRSGLARAFKKDYIDARKVIQGQVIPKGSLVGWQNGETISGHIGIVREEWRGKTGQTIEGNTSNGLSGSQADGNGCYARTRTISPGSYFRITWFNLVSYKSEFKNQSTLETLGIKP